jgi:protein O-GlcNAcase/histone acetyltransferase
MASRGLGGQDYLEILGRTLEPEIDVFWTGPEIISEEISVAQARELRRVLRRKPLLWENLHANDYDGRRFFCGPYAGRPREIRDELSGLLCNPNCELLLNYVPLRTVGQFLHGAGEWDPRQAYLSAIREWLVEFETVGAPINFEDLVLFGDCFYLPYGEGTEAEILMALTQKLLQGDPAAIPEDLVRFRERANRLKVCCGSLANLKNRPLFHALYRRVWELREELDLLQRCVEQRADPVKRDAPCGSDFHLPRTYRGGMVARLQTFLQQEPDGAFIVAPHHMQKKPIQARAPR